MSTRLYLATLTTATTGLILQIIRKGRIKRVSIDTYKASAAGVVDVTYQSTTPSGVNQPIPNVVLARQAVVAGAASHQTVEECDLPVEPFTNIYLFESGAANESVVTLCVQET